MFQPVRNSLSSTPPSLITEKIIVASYRNQLLSTPMIGEKHPAFPGDYTSLLRHARMGDFVTYANQTVLR